MSKEILELKERVRILERKIELLSDLIIKNNLKDLTQKSMSNEEIAQTLVNNGWTAYPNIDCLDDEDFYLHLEVDANENKLSIEILDDEKYLRWRDPCIFDISINLNRKEIDVYDVDYMYGFGKTFTGLEYNKLLIDALENKIVTKLDNKLPLSIVIDGYKTHVAGLDIWDERFNIEYNNPYYCVMYRVDDFYENPIYKFKGGDYLIHITRREIYGEYDSYDEVDRMKIIDNELGNKILEQEHKVALGMILDTMYNTI